jgi:hypothetical protein
LTQGSALVLNTAINEVAARAKLPPKDMEFSGQANRLDSQLIEDKAQIDRIALYLLSQTWVINPSSP